MVLEGAVTEAVVSYDCLWHAAPEVPPGDALLIPRFGWHKGAFYDGPVLWRGRVLVPKGPGFMMIPASSLREERLLAEAPEDDLLGSLLWAGKERLCSVEAEAIEIKVGTFDLSAAVQLVLLRKALPDRVLIYRGQVPSPAWKRCLQNLGIFAGRGAPSALGEDFSIAIEDIFPVIPREMAGGLAEKLCVHSGVIPAQIS